MKYKLWMHIEELDEEEGYYNDLEEHTESIGPEFDTEEEAVHLKNKLFDCVTDDGKSILETGMAWFPAASKEGEVDP